MRRVSGTLVARLMRLVRTAMGVAKRPDVVGLELMWGAKVAVGRNVGQPSWWHAAHADEIG
ncbi:MAG TPA: hypothetical protein VN834_04690 [Candidatus Acidoferrum sp.]|nr:hypothetical protein [Candidatus Acidoferrum sp.]